MKIVDFLIANYHWILAIILLTIITIIGFLADKKKNDKKKENQNEHQDNQDNDNLAIKQQPMIYQPETQNQVEVQQPMMQNNMNMNMDMNNGIINQMNNNQGTIPQPTTYLGELQNNNIMNNPQPVEKIVPEPIPEPMYQPLEEQKPHFAPQPIPNFEKNNEIQYQSPQMMNTQMSIGNQNMMNQQPIIQTIPQQTNMQPEMQHQDQMMQIPNYNQNQNMNGINNYGIPNIIPNQNVIPQPVSPIPAPQQVIPQPIMTNQMQNPEPMGQQPMYNMNQQVSNQNGYIANQNIQQQPTIQQNPQQMQMPNSPINFVYGPQNNNQNM